MQHSSVPCVQVRWLGSFLEGAPLSYHGVGAGLALRDSLGYTQKFLKGQKKISEVISFQGIPSCPAVLPFPAAEGAEDEFEEKPWCH